MAGADARNGFPREIWPRNELDIVVSNPLATAMVLLFVVCGWQEEAVAGVCLHTYLVHSTYVFLVTRATKVGKIVNPAVQHHL